MSSMSIDKIDPATYLVTLASTAPPELQPYFEKFRNQHDRKYGFRPLGGPQVTLSLKTLL